MHGTDFALSRTCCSAAIASLSHGSVSHAVSGNQQTDQLAENRIRFSGRD